MAYAASAGNTIAPVAAPGLLDIPAGVILEAANLPGWRDVHVREHIAAAFGVPTAFQNDANAAAYGEYWAGAGRGARSLLLLTLGTGIGGGIVLYDRVLEGAHSHGGEVGNDRGDTRASAVRQNLIDERGLARAHETGDHGDGQKRLVHRGTENLKVNDACAGRTFKRTRTGSSTKPHCASTGARRRLY